MEKPETQEFSPEQIKQKLWIMWGALIFSMILYGALGAFVLKPEPQEEVAYTTLRVPLFLLALLQTSFILVFWKSIFTPPHGEISAFFVPFILRMALSESIGIYGLVLFMIGAPLTYLYAFIGWGLVLQVSLAPTDNTTQEFRRLYGPKK